MPSFDSFRSRPNVRRAPVVGNGDVLSPREVNMFNASQNMQRNAAFLESRQPAQRQAPVSRYGQSVTSQPGVATTGKPIYHVQRPDGSLVPVAAISGDRALIDTGKHFISPSTGKRYVTDPASVTGMRDIGTEADEIAAKQAAEQAKAAAKAQADATKAAEKQTEEARKLANAEKTNALMAQGRRYFIDRVTGEPRPLQSDEEFAAAQAEKGAKLQVAAATKTRRAQLAKLEFDAAQVNIKDKDLEDADEAVNSAKESIYAARQAAGVPEVDAYTKPFDEAELSTPQGAALKAAEARKKELEAKVATRDALKQQIAEARLRIDNPEAYEQMMAKKVKGETPEVLDARESETAAQIEATKAEIAAKQQKLDAEEQRLAQSLAIAQQRYEKAKTSGNPAILSTAGEALQTIEAEAQAFEEKNKALRDELQAEVDEVNRDVSHLGIISTEKASRRKNAIDDTADAFESALPGMGTELRSVLADGEARTKALQTKYKGREDAPEAKAAFEALQADISGKTKLIEQQVRDSTTERQAIRTAAGIAASKYQQGEDKRANESPTKKFGAQFTMSQAEWNAAQAKTQEGSEARKVEAIKAAGLDPKNKEHVAAFDDAAAVSDMAPLKFDLSKPLKAASADVVRTLSDGSVAVNPSLVHNADRYLEAVELSEATPEAKAAAVAALPGLQLATAKALLPALKSMMNVPGLESFAKWTAANKPDGDEAQQADAYLKAMQARGYWSKLVDSVGRNAIAGLAYDLPAMIVGTAGLVTGSETLSKLAGESTIGGQRLTQTIGPEGGESDLSTKILAQTARMAGPMAAQVLLTRGLGGGQAAIYGGAAAQTAGLQYAGTYQAAREAGKTHGEAWLQVAPWAIGSGLVTAMLTAAGGKSGFEKLMQKGGGKAAQAGNTFWQRLKEATKAITKEAAAEIPEELPDELFSQISEALATDPDADVIQIVAQFIQDAPALIGSVALMGGAGGIPDARRALKGGQDTDATTPDGPLPEDTAGIEASIKAFAPTAPEAIQAMPAAIRTGPKNQLPSEITAKARAAMGGIAKVASGEITKPSQLTETQMRALGVKLDKAGKLVPATSGQNAVAPLIYTRTDKAGVEQLVITDEARTWLQGALPDLTIGQTEAERIQAIEENPPVAPKVKKPRKQKPVAETAPVTESPTPEAIAPVSEVGKTAETPVSEVAGSEPARAPIVEGAVEGGQTPATAPTKTATSPSTEAATPSKLPQASPDRQAKVDSLRAQGGDVVIVQDDAAAEALIGAPLVNKGRRGVTTRVNGKPTVVLIKANMAGDSRSVDALLDEELHHAATMMVMDESPDLAAAAEQEAAGMKGDAIHSDFGKLSNRGKVVEAAAAYASGKWKPGKQSRIKVMVDAIVNRIAKALKITTKEAKPLAIDAIRRIAAEADAKIAPRQPTTTRPALGKAPPAQRKAIGKGAGGQASFAEFATVDDADAFAYAAKLKAMQSKNVSPAKVKELGEAAKDILARVSKRIGISEQEARSVFTAYNEAVRAQAKTVREGDSFQVPTLAEFIANRSTSKNASPVDQAAHTAATSPKNNIPQPTEAQMKAGNYPMGHLNVSGLAISIENPDGSERKWTNAQGESGVNVMKGHYGYIKRADGADGDKLDALVKAGTPEDWNGTAYVIYQNDPKTGKFDEHKVYIGFNTAEEAKAAYLSNYQKGWKGFGSMEEIPMADLAQGVNAGALKGGKGQQSPQPSASSEVPRGTNEQQLEPAKGGDLIAQAESRMRAVAETMDDKQKPKAKAAIKAVLDGLRRYNGHIPIVLTDDANMDFAWLPTEQALAINPETAIARFAADAMDAKNAAAQARQFFRHELIHKFVVEQLGNARVMDIWNQLPPEVQSQVQQAYSVRLLAKGQTPRILNQYSGGHEYYRAMLEATKDGTMTEQVIGKDLADKWRKFLDDVLSLLRDLRKQFASIKSESARNDLIAQVDQDIKLVSDALDAFEKSISPDAEPAQTQNAGAGSTSGKPVEGSSTTVATPVSIKSEKESRGNAGIGSVYETVHNGKTKWAVQMSEKRGFGDYLFDTESEANKASEIERMNRESRAKSIAEAAAREQEQAAKKAAQEKEPRAYAKASGMSQVSTDRAVSVLVQPASRRSQSAGKIYTGTKAEVAAQMVADGYMPKKRDNGFVFEQGDGNSIFKVTKIEHDFAAWLVSQKAAPEVAKPAEEAPQAQEAGQFAAEDKAEFSNLAQGLFASPTAPAQNFKAPIPPAKLGGFITLATKLASREGEQRVDSPEKVAAFIDEALPGGKARALSDAFWSAIRMTNPALPAGEVDWRSVYESIDQPGPDVQEPEAAKDTSHLDAIIERLTRERQRLAEANTDKERDFRRAQIAQAEKELASEYQFLGINPPQSDAGILAELPIAEQGRIITYTTEQGENRIGILLPQGFTQQTEKQKGRRVILETPERFRETLDKGHVVKNDNEAVEFQIVGGQYRIYVPESRAAGGKYWRDPGILEMMRGEFVQAPPNRFTAAIPSENIEKVFTYLKGSGEAFHVTNLGSATLQSPPTVRPVQIASAIQTFEAAFPSFQTYMDENQTPAARKEALRKIIKADSADVQAWRDFANLDPEQALPEDAEAIREALELLPEIEKIGEPSPGGLSEAEELTPPDENGWREVFVSEKSGYKIAVNDPAGATSASVWRDGKRVGYLTSLAPMANAQKAPDGWLGIHKAWIDKEHRGNGLGTEMYRALALHLGEDNNGKPYEGIYSQPLANAGNNTSRHNDAEIPAIYKRLGGWFDKDGEGFLPKIEKTPSSLRNNGVGPQSLDEGDLQLPSRRLALGDNPSSAPEVNPESSRAAGIKPTAPKVSIPDLHAAFVTAKRQQGTDSPSIRAVFDAAKIKNPRLSRQDFVSAIRHGHYTGLVTLKDGKGSIQVGGKAAMTLLPITEAEMMDAADNATETPEAILADWAATEDAQQEPLQASPTTSDTQNPNTNEIHELRQILDAPPDVFPIPPERISREAESLIRWATENGRIIDESAIRDATTRHDGLGGGEEHDVWLPSQAGGRVVKLTKGKLWGIQHSLARYLDTLAESNERFGDDIQLEGVVIRDGWPHILISQPFYEGGAASKKEIDAYFANTGYVSFRNLDGMYTNAAGDLVYDAFGRNVFKLANGSIMPIDVQVKIAYPEPLQASPTASRDAEYMAAVEDGDMEKAQRMVNEAAFEAGFPHSVKHGTAKDLDFSIFDRNARNQAHKLFEMDNWGVWTTHDDARIYGEKVLHLMGKMERPKVFQNFDEWFDDYVKIAYPLFYFEGIKSTELAADLRDYSAGYFKSKKVTPPVFNRSTTKEYKEMLSEMPGAQAYHDHLKSLGYDGVLMEGGFLDGQLQTVRVFLDANQLKSANPVTRGESGNVIPLSERFNPASDSILYANPTTRRRNVANQAAPLPGHRDAWNALSQTYEDKELETVSYQKIEAAVADVISKPAGFDRLYDQIVGKMRNGIDLSLEEDIARRMIARVLWIDGNDNPASRTKAKLLFMADMREASETARKLGSRVDKVQTPQQRLDNAMRNILAPSSKMVRERLVNVWSGAEKLAAIRELERRLKSTQDTLQRERAQRELDKAKARQDQNEVMEQIAKEDDAKVDAILKRQGLTQNDLFLSVDDRYAMQEAVLEMTRAHMGQQSDKHKKAIEMSVRGYSDAAIAKETGLPVSEVSNTAEHFRNVVAKQAIAKDVQAGGTFSKIVQQGKKLISWMLQASPTVPIGSMVAKGTPTAAAVAAQIQAILNASIPTKGQRNAMSLHAATSKGKNGQNVKVFVPYDPSDWKQVYRTARELSTREATYLDKAYEYWINGILSGPQTHVVNTASNLLSTTWAYGPQWFAEATANVLIRNPESPQFGEFRHVFAGFWKGIMPALRNFALAWSNESDPIEHQYLDKPVTAMFQGGNLDKVGGIRPSIGGTLGRIVRVPGRFLVAQDAFAKTLIMHAESAAMAYRLGKKQGLAGAALENFMASQIAQHGSESWQHAFEKSVELTFQDENDITKAVEGVTNALKRAKVVGWLFKFLLPFVRTPTNIYRAGIRKAGGSAGMLLYRLGKSGYYAIRGNSNEFRSYREGKMVKDVSETVMALVLWYFIMGMSEGDDDDNQKAIEITGSRPFGVANAGERASQLRQEGGSNLIIIRKNPLTGEKLDEPLRLPYGRYEPIALAVSTLVDGVREFKEWARLKPQDRTTNALAGSISQHIIAQAKDKTFLQGISGFMDFLEDMGGKNLSIQDIFMKNLFNGVIPNLFRQPLRVQRDTIADSKKPGEVLGSTELASSLGIGEAKINEAGKPVQRSGNAVTRVMFPVPSAPSTSLFDAALKKWNATNPGQQWNPDPLGKADWYVYDPRQGSQKGKVALTDSRQISLFETMVGLKFASLAARALIKEGYRPGQPVTPKMFEAIKDARTEAITKTRQRHPSDFKASKP